jgi:hypothetical protein
LPTTGVVHKKDKITLPKAVAMENNRGSIASVQKAGRVTKRAAVEQVYEDGTSEGESGDPVVTRAAKRARVTIGAPRRSGRHV